MSDLTLDYASQVPRRKRTESAPVTVNLQRDLDEARAELEQLRRKNAELCADVQKLETEHRRYHDVFEMAPDGYVLTDPAGVVTEANRTAAALLSVRQSFLVDKSLFLFMADEARAELETQLSQWQLTAGCRPDRPPATLRGQTQLRVYKGATFPAEFTISPLCDGHNQIVGLRWILRDLSLSTQIQHALRESEYHYRTLFDNAGDAIFIHNLTGRYLEVNRVACESLGYTHDEMLLMTPVSINAPDRIDEIPNRIAQLREKDHIFFETVYVRRDGTTFPVELNSRIIEYAGGPAVLSIARDITDRKRAEEALSRRLRQLALLSEVGRKIAAILGLENVLDQAARLVHESFGYHHVALFIMDEEQNQLIMKALAGNFVNLFPPNHHIQLGRGMVGWVGEHGERILANNVQLEPHYINFYPNVIPTCSELSVPIRLRERTVGVFDVQSPEVNAFDDDDVKVMETLADQIAIAIANARLYEAAKLGRGKPLATD